MSDKKKRQDSKADTDEGKGIVVSNRRRTENEMEKISSTSAAEQEFAGDEEMPSVTKSRGEKDDGGAQKSGSKDPKMKSPPPKINNNLREFRIERMMSKAELARKAGLSVLTVARIEKGFGCRMDTKRKILKALGLKLADRRKVFEDD